jgi:hypothetical protein
VPCRIGIGFALFEPQLELIGLPPRGRRALPVEQADCLIGHVAGLVTRQKVPQPAVLRLL